MRQLWMAAALAAALAACGQGADGPPLPPVKAGATPPSTQSPASPTQQAQVTDEVRQQLIAQIGQFLGATQQQFAAGSHQVGSDTIVPMQPGRDHRFITNLTAGQTYGFIGACDGDCTNVDIELISMETGGVVANDMLPDDFPIASYRPPANGQYMVRLLMQACSTSPCYAGVRTISDTPQGGAPAPSGVSSGTSTGTTAPAGEGGVPGKP
ncbi:MAG: hypothetical protein AB7H66_12090 [Hyphomonadaceae bacterium]